MNGEQPPPAYLKEMKLKRFEDEKDEAEVSKTFHEVYKNLEEWKPSLENELSSQRTQECLIPIEVKELQKIVKRARL